MFLPEFSFAKPKRYYFKGDSKILSKIEPSINSKESSTLHSPLTMFSILESGVFDARPTARTPDVKDAPAQHARNASAKMRRIGGCSARQATSRK